MKTTRITLIGIKFIVYLGEEFSPRFREIGNNLIKKKMDSV